MVQPTTLQEPKLAGRVGIQDWKTRRFEHAAHKSTVNDKFIRGDLRVSLRTDVEIVANVREPGLGSVEAMVLDLSITGFRMRCLIRLTGEKTIFLKLPAFASLESKICWHEADYYGCEFVQSLHPAVYDHIIAQYPSLQMARRYGVQRLLPGSPRGSGNIRKASVLPDEFCHSGFLTWRFSAFCRNRITAPTDIFRCAAQK